jgi:hypothetical protein
LGIGDLWKKKTTRILKQASKIPRTAMPSDIHKYYGLLTRFKGDMNPDTFFDGIDSFEDKGGEGIL